MPELFDLTVSKKKKKNKYHQGLLLSITLTDDKLVHSLLRIIPLSWVRLESVELMRSSFLEDIFPERKMFLRVLRNRHWLCTMKGVNRRTAPLYVIETSKQHRRIFVRFESAFHYRVRSALGRIKSNRNSIESHGKEM